MFGDEENFEEPILKLKRKLAEFNGFAPGAEVSKEKEKLLKKLMELQVEIYSKLTPWQKTIVARHPQRPYTLDYIKHIFKDFLEVHGDRGFSEDHAIVGGMAAFHGREVMVIGHQKGRNTKDRIYRNFGMPHPEGYRKALRLMRMANKFGRPIFTFVDTPGAYPGIGAEERGQAEAIAVSLREMARFDVPILVTITGEGGSGGALAIGVGDRVLMLEHSIYSVISPEGCAAILWKNQEKVKDAAANLRITADQLLEMGIIDEIVTEAIGGAHSDHKAMAEILDGFLLRNMEKIEHLSSEERLRLRYEKFRKMGFFQVSS